MKSAVLTVQTPAKINPVLEVLGKRPDGFHELALVFQAVSLYDRLSFVKEEGQGVRLEITQAPGPLTTNDSNLIVKAARLFLTEVLGNKGAVSIRLEKKIPLAAGLGGGSSDAAATLQALDWLWETHLKEETLNDMGSRLGSDVPFFLKGGTALGLGRGEILTSWNMEGEYNVVLIKPSQGLSTPAVYQSGKASFSQGERARGFQNLMRDGDIKKISQNLYNGLESASFVSDAGDCRD